MATLICPEEALFWRNPPAGTGFNPNYLRSDSANAIADAICAHFAVRRTPVKINTRAPAAADFWAEYNTFRATIDLYCRNVHVLLHEVAHHLEFCFHYDAYLNGPLHGPAFRLMTRRVATWARRNIHPSIYPYKLTDANFHREFLLG